MPSPMHIIRLHLISATLLCLSGCTLVKVSSLKPAIAPLTANSTCGDTSLASIEALEPGSSNLSTKSSVILYDLPRSAQDGHASKQMYASQENAYGYANYSKRIETNISQKIPTELATHRVTVVFRKLLTSTAAEAQLSAQLSEKSATKNQALIQAEKAAIEKDIVTPNLKQSELKDFAKKLFATQMRHGAADAISQPPNVEFLTKASGLDTSTRPPLNNALLAYLRAYYDGKFYDRFGTAISKPQSLSKAAESPFPLAFSVPDSEIVAAETVLLEFLIDTIDGVPVMGNTNEPGDKTIYYPGGTANQPTALATKFVSYVPLPEDGCGITQKNVWLLKMLANSASDQAAAVGGLVANTPGGISLGLGVVGKISIGDNQTLSDMVKAAISEVALRATLTASYYSLRHVQFDIPQP